MAVQFTNFALLSEQYLSEFGVFVGIGNLFDEWSLDPLRYQEQMVKYFGFNPFTPATVLDTSLELQTIGDILNGTLITSKFSAPEATSITLNFLPSYIQVGNLVTDISASDSPIPPASAVSGITGNTVSLNDAIVFSFVGAPSGAQPKPNVLAFATGSTNLNKVRVGQSIFDDNGYIPAVTPTFITNIAVNGGTTYFTLSASTTADVTVGNDCFAGGVVVGDQLSFSCSSLTTNAETFEGSSVLSFATVPPAVLPGISVVDDHSPSRLEPNVQIISKTSTTITLASPALGNIPHGSKMTFVFTP